MCYIYILNKIKSEEKLKNKDIEKLSDYVLNLFKFKNLNNSLA
jgi:hypothetical protein